MRAKTQKMSRKQFCYGTCAMATQLLLGDIQKDSSVMPDWEFPLMRHVDPLAFDLSGYDAEAYLRDLKALGLKETWNRICQWLLAKGETSFLKVGNLGELYEEGLAFRDKVNKKESGQYYTPEDVGKVMAKWFDDVPGDAVCDVGCGVGNLTLAYLSIIGGKKAHGLLLSGQLHLYDIDETALMICLTSIAVRHGCDVLPFVHAHLGDFLDHEMVLPQNSKVISNPPYAAFKAIPENWNKTTNVIRSKELYAAFMEKIMLQSRSSVIITPYSFIGGDKFYPLRLAMNERSGFVVSFDNVPGMIFIGRKHGIFNSNTGNSVRAAITVVDGNAAGKGFRFSPLIRFKNSERERLLTCKTLESFLGRRRQVVTKTNTMFAKCDARLEDVYEAWVQKSDSKVGLHAGKVGKYHLSMPNTCRYFTVATTNPLKRKGQITLCFSDEDVYWYVFCMINSSFAYWFWRMFDGGITYPSGLLMNMPLFYGILSDDDKKFCRTIAKEMVKDRDRYIIRKENVGVQENVKYPREFRDRINQRFLRILGIDADETIFDVVHSNMALEVNLCETKSH